ncbi:MAG: hypothetical protein QXU79_01565 [Candidatus Micrarchaeaceae archaeon]
MSRWKAYENYIAKKVGGKRSTNTLQAQGTTKSDIIIEDRPWYIEVKDQKVPRVLKWWKEVLENARKEKKIPVLVFKGKYREGPVIVMRLRDLEEMVKYGGIPRDNIQAI